MARPGSFLDIGSAESDGLEPGDVLDEAIVAVSAHWRPHEAALNDPLFGCPGVCSNTPKQTYVIQLVSNLLNYRCLFWFVVSHTWPPEDGVTQVCLVWRPVCKVEDDPNKEPEPEPAKKKRRRRIVVGKQLQRQE